MWSCAHPSFCHVDLSQARHLPLDGKSAAAQAVRWFRCGWLRGRQVFVMLNKGLTTQNRSAGFFAVTFAPL